MTGGDSNSPAGSRLGRTYSCEAHPSSSLAFLGLRITCTSWSAKTEEGTPAFLAFFLGFFDSRFAACPLGIAYLPAQTY